MTHKSQQSGFSLVELLISLAISVVAITTAVLLMTKFVRSSAAYVEASTMEEARGSTETLIRADFDGAGYNLTRSAAPGAGKELVSFLTNPDYNTSAAGNLTKLNDNSSWAYANRAITSGVGLWQWTPNTICIHCWTYVVGNDGSVFAIAVYYDQAGSAAICIYESATANYVATSWGQAASIPNHQPGDAYQIGVEAPNASQPNRFIRYYRIRGGVRTILFTSTAPLPPYPLYLMAYQLGNGSGLNTVSFIGAPIANRANNQTEFARLPFDGGTQLTSPITITNNGAAAIVLTGDKSTDVAPSTTNFNSSDSFINLKTPARGTYAVGNVVMLVDYGSTDPLNPISAASAVCTVTAVSTIDSQTTRLTLTRARQTNPAFNRLWSADADHNHSFGAGATSVIKLAPPVTYILSTDSRLVRIEGARASTVAFNARSLAFTETNQQPYRTFSGAITLAAEGFETGTGSVAETRNTIQFTSTPRALNLASNQLN